MELERTVTKITAFIYGIMPTLLQLVVYMFRKMFHHLNHTFLAK